LVCRNVEVYGSGTRVSYDAESVGEQLCVPKPWRNTVRMVVNDFNS